MRLLISCMVAALALSGAAVPNLTGSWNLDIVKSSWGKKAKPQSVVVKVEHNEPRLKYSGVSIDANGEQTSFAVDTAIDGQDHPVKTSYGPGKMTVKRVSPSSISSVYKSDDGKFTEDTTTTVSGDGQTLTRRLHTRGPEGDASWTEVYRRQP